jgi:hypothetical protein
MSGEYAFGPVCGRKLGLITDSPKPKRLTSLFTRVRKSAVRRLEELQMSLELEIPCA